MGEIVKVLLNLCALAFFAVFWTIRLSLVVALLYVAFNIAF